MSFSQVFVSLLKSTPNLVRMLFSLIWAYATLGWRVRRARKAFENELLLQGMSKRDAQKLSSCYDELKKSILAGIKQGIRLRR